MEAPPGLRGNPAKAGVLGRPALITPQPGHLLSGNFSNKFPDPTIVYNVSVSYLCITNTPKIQGLKTIYYFGFTNHMVERWLIRTESALMSGSQLAVNGSQLPLVPPHGSLILGMFFSSQRQKLKSASETHKVS